MIKADEQLKSTKRADELMSGKLRTTAASGQ
jgi:hypothetical protein